MKHPAQFTPGLIDRFAALLPIPGEEAVTVLDPFAGTGRIHDLREFGYETTGVEIEPEWADMHFHTINGDALQLDSLFADRRFAAIVTSPCYGNRMADKHNAKDSSKRITYKHTLGRDLAPTNAGGMQWGTQYKWLHHNVWRKCFDVLEPGGTFILNIKDHIRAGKRQFVAGWHITDLIHHGFVLEQHEEFKAPGMRQGRNHDVRLDHEQIYVLRKPEAGIYGQD